MLERIDRVLLCAADAESTIANWCRLLDAREVRRDALPALGARRTVLALGTAEVEVLEPVAAGPVAEQIKAGRGGPFAAGVAVRDLEALVAHLAAQGIEGRRCGEQVFLDAQTLGIPGLNLMLSTLVERPRAGLLDNLYEVTLLTADPAAAAAALARIFALDAGHFVPIRSEAYGYEGQLTLFHPEGLHRIEIIDPYDRSKTMGRFFERFGPSLYMCYGETDELPALRDRLIADAPHGWTGSSDNDDGLFVHPGALGGVMLGVSRSTYAWTWSGSPARVQPLT